MQKISAAISHAVWLADRFLQRGFLQDAVSADRIDPDRALMSSRTESRKRRYGASMPQRTPLTGR
jgi:hypothetical protein